MSTEHTSNLGTYETGGGTAVETRRASCWATLLRWFLWSGYAYLALSGWVRMANAIGSWGWLQFASIRPGPLYLAITGSLWGVTGLVALVWMIPRRPGYRLVGSGAALLFALTYWTDRLFVATITGASGNILFAMLITLLGLVYVVLMLRPFGDRVLIYQKRPSTNEENA